MGKNRGKSSDRKFDRDLSKKKVVDVNPFELKFNKMKHQILGRKLPAQGKFSGSSSGRIAKNVSQSRKSVLLREYKQFGKDNRFVDRRIGERKAADGYRMTTEEKMAKRFSMERARRSKKLSKYNLNDDPREASLSHLGQSLATIERFERPVDVDDADDAGLDAEFVSQVHFGGMEGDHENPNLVAVKKPGSAVQKRKMALNDLIKQSRLQKHERQALRDDTLDKTEQLDQKWKSLLGTPALGNLSKFGDKQGSKRTVDGFDMLVHQMQFESRAGKAADKILTDADKEKVAEKKKKLAEKKKKEKAAKLNPEESGPMSIDDLEQIAGSARRLPEDRFTVQYSETGELVQQPAGFEAVGGNGKHRQQNSSSFSEDDSSDSEGYEDDDGDDIDEDASDVEDEEEEGGRNEVDSEEESNSSSTREAAPISSRKDKSTSLVAKCPESYDEFRQLVTTKDGTGVSIDTAEMDQTLSQLHSLIQTDRSKGVKLLLYLFRFLDETAEKVATVDDSASSAVIDVIYRRLQALVKIVPADQSEKCCTALTKRYLAGYQNQRARADQSVRDNSNKSGTNGILLKSSPAHHLSIQAYYYLRILPRLFHATDVWHGVLTPALTFITEAMSNVRIRTLRDVAKSLVLCSIWLDYLDQFHRYTPELVCFILAVLQMSLPDLNGERPILPSILALDIHVPLLYVREDVEIDEIGGIIGIEEVFQPDLTVSKQCSIRLCVEILRTLSSLWEQLVSYTEIFDPVVKVLKQLPVDRFHDSVKMIVEETIDDFEKLIGNKTEAKQKDRAGGKKDPKDFKFLEPRMDMNFDPESKKKIPGRGKKAEVKKLTKQVKSETRGAMRELRKDSQFLARTKLQEQLTKDAVRKRKTNALMGSLMRQEGDYNKIKRMKP